LKKASKAGEGQKGGEKGEEKKEEDIKNNDIRDIRSIRQLDKVNLDFDSPRLKQAMDDLGVSIEECMKKYVYFLFFYLLLLLEIDPSLKRKVSIRMSLI
jgi:hypothetical protein